MIFFDNIDAKPVLFHDASQFSNLNTQGDVLLWQNSQTGHPQ